MKEVKTNKINTKKSKQTFTTYAYIELDKQYTIFEDTNKIQLGFGDESLYINKYDLSNYEFKNTFLFKPKNEKTYIVYNHKTTQKCEGDAQEITGYLEKYAKRISVVQEPEKINLK